MTSSLTFVSGIAKKAMMRFRLQKPEYMRKAPPSPMGESLTHGRDGRASMISSLIALIDSR